MVYKSTAELIVLASMNKLNTSPKLIRLADPIELVIGESGSGRAALLRTVIIDAMVPVVTARFQNLEESDFHDLRSRIQTELNIRGSVRVVDVVDQFSTVLEGVLSGKPTTPPTP